MFILTVAEVRETADLSTLEVFRVQWWLTDGWGSAGLPLCDHLVISHCPDSTVSLVNGYHTSSSFKLERILSPRESFILEAVRQKDSSTVRFQVTVESRVVGRGLCRTGQDRTGQWFC